MMGTAGHIQPHGGAPPWLLTDEKLPLSWLSLSLLLPWALTPLPAPHPRVFAYTAASLWLLATLTP